MPRPSRPIWRGHPRNQWCARVGDESPGGGGRKFVYMPREEVRSESDAWRWMAAYEERRKSRTLPAGEPTFDALALMHMAWIEAEVAEGRMAEGSMAVRRTHLKVAASHRLGGGSLLGMTRASAYSVDEHHDLLNSLAAEPCSPHYIRGIDRSVKAMLNWACRPIPGRTPAKLLAANPIAGYRPAVAAGREARYQSQPEIRRFLRWAWAYARRPETVGPKGQTQERPDAARRFDRVFVLMLHAMRLTGARPKELRLSTWADVDWAGGTLTLDPKRHKTGKSTGRERTIYLTPSVARILRALRDIPGAHPDWVFTREIGPGGYAAGFTRETGQPWTTTAAIGRKLLAWRKVAKAAGVPAAVVEGASRMVPYLNRHAYITDAILEGASPTDVAKMVGNSPAVIESTYDHIVKERLSVRAKEIAAKRRKSGKREA